MIASQKPRIVVAIPVKNEEDRISACLEALDGQSDGRADDIVLLLNNCSDRTAAVIRGLRSCLSTRVHVVEVSLPKAMASAGYARHLACEQALRLAGEGGIILTTDADGQVEPDWVGENVAAIRAGADAVAGCIELDPADWANIPLVLHEDDAKECAYDGVCDALHAVLDPDPADPLPRHTQASGASIGVTARAYCAAGGMPVIPAGEDRAFIAALRRVDARIRHSLACRVVVSGRIDGRAAGGMADTIRRRLAAPDLYLDDRLEPAEDCARRAVLRQFARQVYTSMEAPAGWWRHFQVSGQLGRNFMALPSFGVMWDALEKSSPLLERRLVSVAELGRQQAIGRALLKEAVRNAIAFRNTVLPGEASIYDDGSAVLDIA